MSGQAVITRRMSIAFSVLLLPATACRLERGRDDATKAGPSQDSSSETVQVMVEVLEFRRDAMWDHYSDGSFACFAGTRVRPLSPAALVEKDLWLLHSNELPADSPWRRKGARLRFELPRNCLRPPHGSSMELFADALEVEVLADSR